MTRSALDRAMRFAAVAVLVLGIGCGGSDSGDPLAPGGGGGGTAKVVTATINSTAFTGTTVSGALFGTALTVTANNGNKTLSITSNNITGPGTYPLSMGNVNSALAQIIDGSVGTFSTGYLGGSGTLTLTAASLSRVTGTFSFIAYTSAGTGLGMPVVTVQNGVIDITVP